MADKISANQLGLAFGLFAALAHLVWSIAVSFGIQGYVNWILLLHSIQLDLLLTSVNWLNVILLIILAFVGGYIFGWVFAKIYNWAGTKTK